MSAELNNPQFDLYAAAACGALISRTGPIQPSQDPDLLMQRTAHQALQWASAMMKARAGYQQKI